MGQSNVIYQLHNLKIAAEYGVLLTKLRLLNEIIDPSANNTVVVHVADAIKRNKRNNNTVLYDSNIDELTIVGYIIDTRGKLILTIVFNENKYEIPEEISEEYINTTFVQQDILDNKYEEICDRLNELESDYKEILKGIIKEE